MSKVRVIPSTINPATLTPLGSIAKRKVAAYARVSTDSDEQYTSYEMQVKVYKKMIEARDNWEYVNVYADEGISGTSTKRREDFNKMINDAKAGLIDLIITKSISRFARNTLDTIAITRELKARGIEVYFEKENLWSLDDKTEFLLTIMASMAQEESRSISQNVKMGKRWAMQEGKVSFAYKTFLGYKKENDKIVIDEDQANLVRLIYRMFLKEGKTCSGIAEYLKAEGFKTPSGKGTNWTKNTIYSILTNEKYKGDALLQKTYCDNYLDHSVKKNKGQLPQYYVENSHPHIIEKNEWEIVQTEIKRREKIGASYSGNSIFASKLICNDCGGFYGKKLWHSNDKYAKTIYRCNKKYSKTQSKCQTPTLSEQEIKDKFIKAYNIFMQDKDRVLKDTEAVIAMLTTTDDLDIQIEEYNAKLNAIAKKVEAIVREGTRTIVDQIEFSKRYSELQNQYEAAKKELEDLVASKAYKEGQALKLKSYLETMKEMDSILLEWSDDIWMILVEKAIVDREGIITFKFTNGTEIKA